MPLPTANCASTSGLPPGRTCHRRSCHSHALPQCHSRPPLTWVHAVVDALAGPRLIVGGHCCLQVDDARIRRLVLHSTVQRALGLGVGSLQRRRLAACPAMPAAHWALAAMPRHANMSVPLRPHNDSPCQATPPAYPAALCPRGRPPAAGRAAAHWHPLPVVHRTMHPSHRPRRALGRSDEAGSGPLPAPCGRDEGVWQRG